MGIKLLIVSKHDYGYIKRNINKIKEGKYLIIGLDSHIRYKLKDINVKCKSPADYLNSFENEIDYKVADLTKSWYKHIENDFVYEGISLGQILEYDILFLFADMQRCLLIAKSVFEKEDIDLIISTRKVYFSRLNNMFYFFLPELICSMGRKRDIKILFIPLSNNYKIKYHLNFLKKRFQELAFNKARKIKYSLNSRTIFNDEKTRRIWFVNKYESINNQIKNYNNLIPIYQYPFLITTKKEINAIKTIQSFWNEIKNDKVLLTELFDVDNKLQSELTRCLNWIFTVRTPYIIRFIAGTNLLLDNIEPSILVIAEDVTPESRIMVELSKMRKIPSLVIQHGIYNYNEWDLFVMPIVAEKQAVWGEKPLNDSIKMGKSPKSQVLTGNPKFDNKFKHYNKESLKKKIGIRADNVVLIAPSWASGTQISLVPELNEYFLKKTLKSVSSIDLDIDIVVKLHPTDYDTWQFITNSILNEYNIKAIVTKDHLDELLYLSDVVIINSSTVGLEAMIFDKPLITVNLGWKSSQYSKGEAAINLNCNDNLGRHVKDVLIDPMTIKRLKMNRKKFINENAYLQDDKAGLRVIKLILDMIEY